MAFQKEPDQLSPAFIEKVLKERGLDLNNYEQSFLTRRIQAAMVDKKIDTYEDYAEFLELNPREYERLFSYLYINKTEFFRDKGLWDYLRQVLLPEYFAKVEYTKKNKKIIRIWSAGCASGEEAYSIAILVWDLLKENVAEWDIQIFAIDMNAEAITIAQKALYDKEQMLNVSYDQYSYFHPQDSGQYFVDEKIKNLVWFRNADLITMMPPIDNDLIFCRNIMIYFKRDLQEKLKNVFAGKLRAGGYLILGNAELMTGSLKNQFIASSDEFKIYQKK